MLGDRIVGQTMTEIAEADGIVAVEWDGEPLAVNQFYQWQAFFLCDPDSSESYLSAGGGLLRRDEVESAFEAERDRLTVADLNRWQLPDVDLVVFSACKTAVSSELRDGAEILGFGYQMQQAGATAAIASLWQVSDGGTQVLMDSFYAALNNGHSKAEALQRAQIALITSDETVLAGERGTGTIAIVDQRTGQPLSQSSDLTHPYYWAPFILIGNGL